MIAAETDSKSDLQSALYLIPGGRSFAPVKNRDWEGVVKNIDQNFRPIFHSAYFAI